MGQAKDRGTYEQRVAQAKARQEAELQAAGERMEAARKAEREGRITASVAGHDVEIALPRYRISRSLALAAAIGMLAAGGLKK